MRILTNERRVRRGRFLATSLSVSGILMLLSSWIGVVFYQQAVGMSTMPLLLFGTILSLAGIHFTRKWVRIPRPPVVLATALKGLGKDAVLLNYFGAIDHIVLTRHGAFSVTTRNQPFNLQIDGSKWLDKAPLGERLQRTFARDTIGNPLSEAQHDANKAATWLTQILGQSVSVQPLIVFLNQKTYLEVVNQPEIPVMYADKRTPTLKAFLRSEQATTLTPQDLHKILSAIEPHTNEQAR